MSSSDDANVKNNISEELSDILILSEQIPAHFIRNDASGLSHLKDRVKALELNAGVIGCELPIGYGATFVAIFLPCGNFLGQSFLIGDAAVETLTDQNADLGLGHVEPTAMLGRVVPFKTSNQTSRFAGREGLI